MRTRKRFFRIGGSTLFLTLAGLGFAQTDLRADSIFLSDRDGTPIAPQLGEPVYVGLRFTVTGTPNSTYRYRVEGPYTKADTSRLSFGAAPGEYWVSWGPVPMLLAGSMTLKVTLDPEKKVRESNRANNTLSYTFTPAPPASPIEEFAPRTVFGKMGMDVSWKSSSAVPQRVTFWMPESSRQSATRGSLSQSFLELISERFGQPIAARTISPSTLAPLREEVEVLGTATSVRSNRSLLIGMGSGVEPEMFEWRESETLVESQRPEIIQWAASALASAAPGASTYERAEVLYRSVLKKCTYEYRPGLSASALNMAKKKKGDCGGFSSLFVALCRASGIPARVVAGFGLGANKWHAWAEFHVAGAGWVPVDPAFAEGRLAKGVDLPIYFGVIPERNERFETMIGLDRSAGGLSLPILQSPAVFWFGNGIKLNKAAAYCQLSIAP